MAHWFQLKREKGNLIPSEVEETALLGGGYLTRFPPLARLKPEREQDPWQTPAAPGLQLDLTHTHRVTGQSGVGL